MTDRSATSTIKGYMYQFDFTILSILNRENKDSKFIVEKVEDLDVETATEITAIQCKYYQETEYNHSVIAKPIRLMLNDFKQRKDNKSSFIKYSLYGYYKSGQHKLPATIDLDFLKANFLTYKKNKEKYLHHNDLELTDADLELFLSYLSIDNNALEYQAQIESIYKKLQEIFNCDAFEAEHYYYNNTLNEIKKLSVESDEANREITKSHLLSKINNKRIIFNKWFIQFKGKKQHFRNLRKQFFSQLNNSPFDRFFLIEVNKDTYIQTEINEILLLISEKYSKISKREINKFCPFIYIHGLEESELIAIKTQLQKSHIVFIDGYQFAGSKFSTNLMLQELNKDKPCVIKFLNSIDDFNQTLQASDAIKQVFQFYINEPFFNCSHDDVKHIQIQIEDTNDIKEII